MNIPSYGYSNNGLQAIRYIRTGKRSGASLKNLNKGFATLGVSRATQSKIAKHCRVLGMCATKRTVRNSAGKYLSHLCSFITLTLPSEQVHDDKEITKIVLGTFLDKCRKLGLLQNYVWRAEKQKNGNIHYHVLTDTFANYSLFKRIWFIALRKLGYMEAYHDKFSKMSFSDYSKLPFNKNRTPQQVVGAYAHGVRNRWSEPPSAHVDYLNSMETVAKYVGKYVSKSDPGNPNIVQGRTWGKSSSVSEAVKNICSNLEISKYWYSVGTELMNRGTFEGDFFSICKFKITSLFAWFPDAVQLFKDLYKSVFQPCDYWRNSVGLYT